MWACAASNCSWVTPASLIRMPIATEFPPLVGYGGRRPPARSRSLSSLALLLLGLCADLLEQCHRVEVVATRLDLRALEHVEDCGGCLLALARSRDRSCCGCKRAGLRALPGHFQNRGVTA